MSEKQAYLAELEVKVKDFCNRALAMATKLNEVYEIAAGALSQESEMQSQHSYNPVVLREALNEIVEVITRA